MLSAECGGTRKSVKIYRVRLSQTLRVVHSRLVVSVDVVHVNVSLGPSTKYR